MGDQLQAIMEGERFISQKPEGINEAALPDVYLGVALAKEKVGDVKGAFEYAFTAFSISQRLPSHLAAVKENSLRLAEHLLLRAKEEKLDLDQDGAPDPGNLSETTWIAQKLLLNSDRSGARAILLRAATDNVADAEGKFLLKEIQEEDRLNEEQERRANFSRKYLRMPNSRFDAYMGLAFMIKKNHKLAFLSGLGESIVNHAVNINPTSADAQLLKGWYLYDRHALAEAIVAAQRAIEVDPEYANGWLGLGHFLLGRNQHDGAVESFRKTLELYPGSPQRNSILELVRMLENQPFGSVSPRQPDKS
jgi:tetratricopeptide (TPR) repeat protein